MDTAPFAKAYRQLPGSFSRGILDSEENHCRMLEGSKRLPLATLLLLAGLPALSFGQNPPPERKLPAGPPAPQSTHYPILLLAFGNDPHWSLRIGQKVPERLYRPGYPPIPLEPSDITHESAADSWTYHAKHSATRSTVALHLPRH